MIRLRWGLGALLVVASLIASIRALSAYLSHGLWLGSASVVVLAVIAIVGFVSLAQARRRIADELLGLAASPPRGALIASRQARLAELKQRGVTLDLEALTAATEADERGSAYLGRYFVAVTVLVGLVGTFSGLMETLRAMAPLLQDEQTSTLKMLAAPLAGLDVTFGASIVGILVTLALSLVQGDLVLAEEQALAQLAEQTVHRLVPALWPAAESPTERTALELAGLRADMATLVKRSAGEVAAATGAALNRLVDGLGARLAELQTTLVKVASESNQALAKVGEASHAAIAKASESATAALAAATQASATSLAATHAQHVAALDQAVNAATATLEKSTTAATAALDKTANATIAAFDKSTTAATAALDKSANATIASLDKSTTAAITSLDKSASATSAALDKSATASIAALDKSASTSIAELAKRSAAAVSASDEAQRTLAAALAAAGKALDVSLGKTSQAVATELAQLGRALGNDVATASRAVVDQLAATGATVTTHLDQTSQATAGALTGSTTALTTALQQTQVAVATTLRDSLDGAGAQLASATTALGHAASELRAATAELAPSVNKLAPELAALSHEIALLAARADTSDDPLVADEIVRLGQSVERLEALLRMSQATATEAIGATERAMKRRSPSLFPVNVWPPFVDALTLVLAAFVLLIAVGAVAQSGLIARLRRGEADLDRLREEKARIERRLAALSSTGAIVVEEGKVIVQGELLFASGSEELSVAGRDTVVRMAPALTQLVLAEADQMILIGGHTDDVPIATQRFASNWELSAARATSVARALVAAGFPSERVVASGFGPYHPRLPNRGADERRQNRRIEVMVVPMRAMSSR